MANFIIDPNMGFANGIPGVDPGPDYATNQFNTNTTIGAHNHSAGSGVLINPSGININTDFPMNGNNLTLVNTVNFNNLGTNLPGAAPNLGCIYVAGGELVYNDESGNVVPITNMGTVNAGAGSITGLPSGTASATYSASSSTFIWQSATSTPANLDAASVIFRNLTANSKGLTLNPPNAMGADYSVTLPSPNTSGVFTFLTLDTSNNMSQITSNLGIVGANIAPQTITQDKLAPMAAGVTVGAGGFATSTSSGSFSTSSTSYVDVTNLTVTITTTGRPVKLELHSLFGGDNLGTVQLSYASNTSGTAGNLAFLNGAAIIESMAIEYISPGEPLEEINYPPSSFTSYDFPVAGTYSYKVQVMCVLGAGTVFTVFNTVLTAYEI